MRNLDLILPPPVVRPFPAGDRERGLMRELRGMLRELESSRLEVILTPAPEPKHSLHFVRTVQSSNPGWYREFCSLYHCRRRKPRHRAKYDTLIRRRATLAALRRMLKGDRTSVYAQRLLRFIERRGRR